MKTEGILSKESLSNDERETLGFADLQSEANRNVTCH